MKLYIWNDPYHVSYGSSLVFAIAKTVEQAKTIASNAPAYCFGYSQQSTPQVKLGEPTRIVDLPCAEWHEWSE